MSTPAFPYCAAQPTGGGSDAITATALADGNSSTEHDHFWYLSLRGDVYFSIVLKQAAGSPN